MTWNGRLRLRDARMSFQTGTGALGLPERRELRRSMWVRPDDLPALLDLRSTVDQYVFGSNLLLSPND